MNKKRTAAIGVTIVIISTSVVLVYKYSSKSEYSPKNTAAQVAKSEDAAKLYDGKVEAKTYGPDDPKDKDVSRTGSIYQPEPKPGAEPTGEFVSLTTKVPKTPKGIIRIKKDFETARSSKGMQIVTGYGDTAFWDTKFGQLNILSHDTWYQLTVDSFRNLGNDDPTKHNLERTKEMANLIKDRF